MQAFWALLVSLLMIIILSEAMPSPLSSLERAIINVGIQYPGPSQSVEVEEDDAISETQLLEPSIVVEERLNPDTPSSALDVQSLLEQEKSEEEHLLEPPEKSLQLAQPTLIQTKLDGNTLGEVRALLNRPSRQMVEDAVAGGGSTYGGGATYGGGGGYGGKSGGYGGGYGMGMGMNPMMMGMGMNPMMMGMMNPMMNPMLMGGMLPGMMGGMMGGMLPGMMGGMLPGMMGGMLPGMGIPPLGMMAPMLG